MRLAAINPHSTVSMTVKIAAAARFAAPGADIDGRTCAGSPSSIQGPQDGAAALPHLLAEVRAAAADDADACIIACFDDTGLTEARAAVAIPVLGIGEAAFPAAMMLGHHYSVVTTLSVSIPVIVGSIRDYGLGSHCMNVRASEVAVLDLERLGSDACAKIPVEIADAIYEDGAGAIVLGCAGMADLAADLSREHGLPVIDGVAAARGFAQTLVLLKLGG